MKTDTKGESVFKVVQQFFLEKDIPLKNMISCATDGAPSMVGKYKGFLAFMKKELPNLLTIHCVIHRQHLVAKNISETLSASLKTIIKAVNKIKAHALNTRLFKQLCQENDEEFERLLLHTEVRWLSKGNCLDRFYTLYKSVVEFIHEIDVDLCSEIKDISNDVAYLSDIFRKLNSLNLELQGNGVTLIMAKSKLKAFIAKLELCKQNLGSRKMSNFQNLQKENDIPDSRLIVYAEHLDKLINDMRSRFEDILNMDIPAWVINPFINISEVDETIQEEMIDVQNDEELKPAFKRSVGEFWLQPKIQKDYSSIWAKVKLFFIAFPTSYLVEKAFSAVFLLQSKQRQNLMVATRGDLRLMLTKMSPNLQEIMQNNQAQGSH